MKDNRKIFNWFVRLDEFEERWHPVLIPGMLALLVMLTALAVRHNELLFLAAAFAVSALGVFIGIRVSKIVSKK